MAEQRYRKPTMGVRFSQVAHMSRLEQHQQKEFNRKVALYAGLIIVLVILMGTVGLKTIINGTIFFNSLGSKQSGSSQSDRKETMLGTLDIDSIADATNSAKIVVSGSVANYDKLAFYINDKKVKESNVDYETFNQEIGDLNKGDNKVYVIASNKDTKEERKSPVYTVSYRNEKPKLEISEPQDHMKTGSSDIKVAGKTDKEILIKVNEFPVVVDAQGNFQTSVRLKDGDNPITVTASDNAGNTESKSITVTYQKDY